MEKRLNYFDNLLLWSGKLLMNAPNLIQDPTDINNLDGDIGGGIIAMIWGTRHFFTALLSPLFMWWLFLSQANGSMTNAVELGQQFRL